MRLLVYAIWLVFFAGCHTPQSKNNQEKQKKARTNLFVTKVYNLNNLKDRREFEKWEQKNIENSKIGSNEIIYHDGKVNVKGLGILRFEDENFKVFSNCKGEWGGSLTFIDRKTQQRYEVSSDCPLMIENQAGQYTIVSTLAHMSGSLSVETIPDPRNLSVSEQSSKLISTDGLTASLFFSNQGKHYLIYSDQVRTYLGKVQNQKLIPITTLLQIPIYVKEDKMNKVINGIYLSELLHRTTYRRSQKGPWVNITTVGRIYAKGDTILLGYYYKKKVTKEYSGLN